MYIFFKAYIFFVRPLLVHRTPTATARPSRCECSQTSWYSGDRDMIQYKNDNYPLTVLPFG